MNGSTVKTPASQVDSADAKQIFVKSGALPNGLYTVVWSVASAADGHHTEGSFPFTIGPAVASQSAAGASSPTIPITDVVVRWINLCSLALAIGGIGFVCFVWSPAVSESWPVVEHRLNLILDELDIFRLSGVLLLLLQTATMVNIPLLKAVGHPALLQVIQNTGLVSYGRHAWNSGRSAAVFSGWLVNSANCAG